MNIYQRNGYNDRRHYLLKLSENYHIDFDTVCRIADILGDDKDFNGLEDILFYIWQTIRDECETRKRYEESMEKIKSRYRL